MKHYCKNCKICGETFLAEYPHTSVCSDECRAEMNRLRRYRMRTRAREKAMEHLPPCRICGNPVGKVWTGTRNSQSYYHTGCIVNLVKSVSGKRGTEEYKKAIKLARNHGMSKKGILAGLYDEEACR